MIKNGSGVFHIGYVDQGTLRQDIHYSWYQNQEDLVEAPTRPGSVRRSWKVDKQGSLIYTCEELVYCAQCLEANLVVKTVWGKRV